MEQLVDLAGVPGMTISGTLREQIEKAITAHSVWKVRLTRSIEMDHLEMNADVARLDDQCPLGQWLHQGIDPNARASSYYQQASDLHAKFHHAAADVLALAAHRHHDEALAAMEMGTTFKSTSTHLIEVMTAWQETLPS
jgi:methyl-accepting chemotaxis protein